MCNFIYIIFLKQMGHSCFASAPDFLSQDRCRTFFCVDSATLCVGVGVSDEKS